MHDCQKLSAFLGAYVASLSCTIRMEIQLPSYKAISLGVKSACSRVETGKYTHIFFFIFINFFFSLLFHFHCMLTIRGQIFNTYVPICSRKDRIVQKY